MKRYWLFLAAKVESMTLRERIFILVAGLALIWMPGYSPLAVPIAVAGTALYGAKKLFDWLTD